MGLCILLVGENLTAVKDCLERDGHQVCQALTLADAEAAIAASKRWDAVATLPALREGATDFVPDQFGIGVLLKVAKQQHTTWATLLFLFYQGVAPKWIEWLGEEIGFCVVSEAEELSERVASYDAAIHAQPDDCPELAPL